MKLFKINAIFILVLVSIVSSCCKSKMIGKVYFFDDELAVNPYTGSEELKFLDDSSNVIIYNNGHRKITENEVRDCKEGCCDYYLVEEHENTIFRSEYLESNFQVIISSNFDKYSGYRDAPTLHFGWFYYEGKPNSTGTSFAGLPVDSLYEKAVELGWYQDSLMLRDKLYNDVYTIPGYTSHPESLYGDTLFYNLTEGIIGMKLSNGNLWIKM